MYNKVVTLVKNIAGYGYSPAAVEKCASATAVNICLVRSPVNRVVRHRCEKWSRTQETSVREVKGRPFNIVSDHFTPSSVANTTRELVFGCENGWTYLVNNSTVDIVDMSLLASRLNTQSLLASHVPAIRGLVGEREKAEPRTELRLFGPEGTPPFNLQRLIATWRHEGRWLMEDKGTTLAWEDLYRLRSGAVRQRFTFDMLQEYCAHFDAFPFEDSFYLDEAALLEIGG